MTEDRGKLLSPESWSELIGPVASVEKVSSQPGIVSNDLIVLTTQGQLRVCPVKQFETVLTPLGDPHWKTSRYVGLGWKVGKLSGMGEWTCAGAFFSPRRNQSRSYCDMLVDNTVPHDYKIALLGEILEDEFARSAWAGDEDRLRSDLVLLGEEYGFELANQLLTKGTHNES